MDVTRAGAAAIRLARPEDCDAIAAMVRRLAADTRQTTIPKATGDDLRAEAFGPASILTLLVADRDGLLVGALIGSTIYSTWRAGRGMYVVDLFVDPDHRGDRLGERLVVAAARQARSAGGVFVKLEVVAGNDRAKRFYRRLGFEAVEGDENFVLKDDRFAALAGS